MTEETKTFSKEDFNKALDKLQRALEQLEIDGVDDKLQKFEKYMAAVLEWNEKVNLTAIKEPEAFVVKHFIDSVIPVCRQELKAAEKIIDVGSGAGFPGVPLSIIFPEKKILLLDSLAKRMKIVKEICEELLIENIETMHGRAEEIAQNPKHRENYDLCVSRAVANLATLSEYCIPFVKKGGTFMAYKGPEADNEIQESGRALALLGGKIKEVMVPELSEFDLSHRIVIIEKDKNTPSKFPRRAGIPSKEPLK